MKKYLVILTVLLSLIALYPIAGASDNVMIQIRFKIQTECGEYSDALYFTPEEYAALAPGQLERMEQARVDSWVNQIKNPPISVEPTKEQLLHQKQQLIDSKVSIDAQIADIDTKLEDMN